LFSTPLFINAKTSTAMITASFPCSPLQETQVMGVNVGSVKLDLLAQAWQEWGPVVAAALVHHEFVAVFDVSTPQNAEVQCCR
jgi:hypothetical protein